MLMLRFTRADYRSRDKEILRLGVEGERIWREGEEGRRGKR
jgi:hypothetical protein